MLANLLRNEGCKLPDFTKGKPDDIREMYY
jgi:hypothetical protein